MRIVFLTGIWPPDVGGPATHGPDFARFLRDRGHQVEVVTMADDAVTDRPVPVHAIGRARPFVVRYPQVGATAWRRARRADVIYATATYAAAAVASVGSRRPLVVKLVSDPAYERAQRYGLFGGSLEEFQTAGGRAVTTLQRLRSSALTRARRVIVPSRYLAAIALGWGLDPERVEVLINPAPEPKDVEPEPLEQGTFVFVGRLTAQKALPVALAAIREVAAARLVLVGDGPERASLVAAAAELGVAGRVRFAGALSRDDALRYLAGGRAALLSSAWENLPHAAVEALSVGTPVVATAVGGVPEVVRDGENGLLVQAGDVTALAGAIRAVLEDDALHARLAAGARESVAGLGRDATYGRLEQFLLEARA
jgi:glycosyltransferase involved in cell wall biosynthesis